MIEADSTVYPVSIKQAAQMSGLSEHTLRYYEKIGLLPPIQRDATSGYRWYSERDVSILQSLSYLSTCNVKIADMRQYLIYISHEEQYAQQAADLFIRHEKEFAYQVESLQLQHRYIQSKVAYWTARIDGDEDKIAAAIAANRTVARQLMQRRERKEQASEKMV